MTKEDGVQQALEASRRCLQAVAETDDFETQRSLWRAALRYRALAREKRLTGAGEFTPASLTRCGSGAVQHVFE